MAHTATFNSPVSGSLFDMINALFVAVGESMRRSSSVEQFSL